MTKESVVMKQQRDAHVAAGIKTLAFDDSSIALILTSCLKEFCRLIWSSFGFMVTLKGYNVGK